MKDQIGADIDAFKTWYSLSRTTFKSTDPLFTNNYIPKAKIVTKIVTIAGVKSYYKGEVDDEGERHGAGLTIIPFEVISEAYYKNGFSCGECKYVRYEKNDSGQIQFGSFVKHFYERRIGQTGFYQLHTQNGRVIKEGYQKNKRYYGEQKLNSNNKIQYCKWIDEDVPLWY